MGWRATADGSAQVIPVVVRVWETGGTAHVLANVATWCLTLPGLECAGVFRIDFGLQRIDHVVPLFDAADIFPAGSGQSALTGLLDHQTVRIGLRYEFLIDSD